MTDWVHACGKDQLSEGGCLSAIVEGRLLALFMHEGEYYATQGICTHGNAMLAKGTFQNGEIRCPLHDGRFCVKTGEPTGGPVWEDLRTYRVRIEKGNVEVLV